MTRRDKELLLEYIEARLAHYHQFFINVGDAGGEAINQTEVATNTSREAFLNSPDTSVPVKSLSGLVVMSPLRPTYPLLNEATL